MRETAELFEDLRGFEILDCGHFIHRDRPGDFVATVLPFLRDASYS
jgi:pimeloyl-ACP methyl ester carboxylesterase